MQDEVCAAWALLDLSTLPSLHAARTLSLPLHGGPLARHWTLRQCGEAALAAASAAAGSTPAASAVPRLRDASLAVTLRPVPPADTAAVLLPPLALAAAPLARVVSLYRGLLAEALGTAEVKGLSVCQGQPATGVQPARRASSDDQPAARMRPLKQQMPPPLPTQHREAQGRAGLAPTADHVLAAFPAALDDPDLVAAFFGWVYSWVEWRRAPACLALQRRCPAGSHLPPTVHHPCTPLRPTHTTASLWRQELARLSAEHKKAATPVEGGELRAAFRRCATAVWALQRAQMLPPPAGAGDVAGSAARRQAVQLNLQQHPGEGQGVGGGG